MTIQPSLLFVFGLGYSAMQLAGRFLQSGGKVAGTVRSVEKRSVCQQAGVAAQIWTGKGAVDVPAGAHWLISVPPDDEGCPAARAMGETMAGAASVTYLSTTGVYGDLSGGWAMEWSSLNPQSRRAERRVRAEQQWHMATNGAARIVRLPGIYGPGRSAFDALREGRARRIVKEGQVFSRVHVDDIASGLWALCERPQARGVFHLCDDLPAPPQDVVSYAAGLLGLAAPDAVDIEEADLSPMARSFYAECKRVSNARTKSKLNWRPTYPTYQEGLQAILSMYN